MRIYMGKEVRECWIWMSSIKDMRKWCFVFDDTVQG